MTDEHTLAKALEGIVTKYRASFTAKVEERKPQVVAYLEGARDLPESTLDDSRMMNASCKLIDLRNLGLSGLVPEQRRHTVNIPELQRAVSEIKRDIEAAIQTASCLGKEYDNGQRAKEALIRSQRLIMKVHEVTKVSLSSALRDKGLRHQIHPPIGASAPELKVTGLIKAKQQDVVALMEGYPARPEAIAEGPLAGVTDPLGKAASERAIVVGVRSQMSSVSKNFDTLMERAFAETLNLRLRLPKLVMAEVYLLPVVEYDDAAMVTNRVAFKQGFVPVDRFIKTFIGISGRDNDDLDASLYKYDRSCLVLIDCRKSPPRVFETLDELKREGVVPNNLNVDFRKLTPRRLCRDLVEAHVARHDG